MAAEGDRIIRFNYTGGDRRVPRDVTHITIAKSVTVIPVSAFDGNPNIVEVICDENVKRVEERAFFCCTSLRRVIMPGVEVVEMNSLAGCFALTDIECGKLERIKDNAFSDCNSLRSIDLPSTKFVGEDAFSECISLTDAKFGSKLERIEVRAFVDCRSLEPINIPLKDGIITHDDTFQGCENLKHVDLVEGELHETVAALQLEVWRNDMNEEIDSINQILPTVDAGSGWDEEVGEKARVIRGWIRSVLRKVIHYKAEHQRILDEEVATTLQLVLPRDIVMNNVRPFLELPSYTFEVEDYEEGEEEDY